MFRMKYYNSLPATNTTTVTTLHFLIIQKIILKHITTLVEFKTNIESTTKVQRVEDGCRQRRQTNMNTDIIEEEGITGPR